MTCYMLTQRVPLLLIMVVAAYPFVGGSALRVSIDPVSSTVLHVSDIHLDPYYGQQGAAGFTSCNQLDAPWNGTRHCDSPLTLAQAAITQLEVEISTHNVSVILYTGDWVRHDTGSLPAPASDMVTIFSQVAELLQQLVSGIAKKAGKMAPLVVPHPTAAAAAFNIGNEDFYPDYNANEQSIPTSNIVAYSKALQFYKLLTPNQTVQYSRCAFYESEHPSGTLIILAMNTVLYSVNANTSTEDPCGQFAWLRDRLGAAQGAGRMVYLTAHIPPMVSLWEPKFVTSFNDIIQTYSSVIAAQFFGHLHMTLFLAPSSIPSYPPLFIGGSITRISDTNTCYQRYTVDSQWNVNKWEQIRLSASQNNRTPFNASWELSLDVGKALGIGSNDTVLTQGSLLAMANQVKATSVAFNAMDLLIGGGYPSSLVDKVCQSVLLKDLCRKGLYCVLTEQTIEGVIGCGILQDAKDVITPILTAISGRPDNSNAKKH